jgi:prolyl oligopeptidase
MRPLSLLLAAALIPAAVAAAPDPPATTQPDPFLWLEAVRGPRAMAWVKEQNQRALARLEADFRYEPFRRLALEILTAPDRIAWPAFLGARLANLWQDAAHPHGLWRAAGGEDFAAPAPRWTTLIDLDDLSRVEGRAWFFKGAECLAPDDRLCLVRLSDGGGDAVEVREFDTLARRFVPGGFRFAAGKQTLAWLDADTVLAARDFGPGTVTSSGYPLSVRLIRRGEDPAGAREVFRGEPTDVQVVPHVLRRPDGAVALTLIAQARTFFETRWLALERDGATRELDLPRRVQLHGWLDGRLVLTLRQAWIPPGSRVALPAGASPSIPPAAASRPSSALAPARPSTRSNSPAAACSSPCSTTSTAQSRSSPATVRAIGAESAWPFPPAPPCA